jgi:hypothetical protein
MTPSGAVLVVAGGADREHGAVAGVEAVAEDVVERGALVAVELVDDRERRADAVGGVGVGGEDLDETVVALGAELAGAGADEDAALERGERLTKPLGVVVEEPAWSFDASAAT